jgi:hypothetical protein
MLLAGSALFIATALLYSPLLHHSFINYDDPTYLLDNPHVQTGLSRETIAWAATSTYAANWHPLTWIAHALNWQLFGAEPGGHHAASLLLHAMNAVLLFAFLARVTGAAGRSWLVAALFAVHPLNVEPVAWAAELKTPLSTLFFLLALLTYEIYAERPSLLRYLAVAAWFALGLAAKPIVIILPFLLLLLDRWPLQRVGEGKPGSWGWLALEKMPLLLMSGGSAVLTLVAQRSGGAMVSTAILPFSLRVGNAIRSYAAYLMQVFWPAGLAPFYPGTPLTAWNVGASLAVIAFVGALVWRERKREYLVSGWLWFLGTLVPVIGLVQVGGQSRADRYCYIPLIGIFIMLVWGGADLIANLRLSPTVVRAATAVILAALCAATWHQTGFWRDDETLWTHTIAVTGNNLVAEHNLGITLVQKNRLDEALAHFQNAVKIDPADATSLINIAADHQDHGRYREAVGLYQKALASTNDPGLRSLAYRNLGNLYLESGDLPQAAANYREDLALHPDDAEAKVGLARAERMQPEATGPDLSRN